MIKYLLMAVAAAAIFGIGWPLATAIFAGGPNEATRLVEATSRTNNKAESLNDSFTDVIPPAPRRSGQQLSMSQPARGFVTSVIAPSDGLKPDTRDGSQNSGEPQPSPTPDKYAQYEHPSEHAVRDAIEYLNRLQADLEPSQTEYIQAVEQLQRAWNPRYQRAVEEYKRFAYRIDHADAMAIQYFEVQEGLTGRINRPDDRRRAEKIDAAERKVYNDWRDQAFRTLGQANLIMFDLHDMNVIITKQSLSAYFAALYEDFQAIPPAITLLHEELARFRAESDKIQATFGVSVK